MAEDGAAGGSATGSGAAKEAGERELLADLAALRRRAKAAYESDGDLRQGQLWLAAIKEELNRVKPEVEPDPLEGTEDEAILDELERRGIIRRVR